MIAALRVSSRALVAAAALIASPVLANDRDVQDIYAALSGADCKLAGEAINRGMEHGEPKAFFFAGYLYDISGCVADDPVRAERYYLKADELGDPDAPEFLGLLHGLGRGVPQDYAVAYDWYVKRRRTRESVAQLDENAAQVAGYAMTVALLARQYALYPDDAQRAGIESTLEVVFDPVTRQVDVRDHLSSVATGSRVAKKDIFVTHVKAAYQAGIAIAPPLQATAPTSVRYATPWRFGRVRDITDDSLRTHGPIVTEDTYPLPNT